MKILHISDTHGKHKQFTDMPEADVIVHSGDITFAGSEDEAFDFINWFCDLPYRHKIFIAGNHDACLYGADGIEGLPNDTHFLYNSSVTIDGLKFYGIPLFLEDCMNETYPEMISAIPSDTDVLITHQPPRGICDIADYGSGPSHHGGIELANRLKDLHLKCHLFGHEHDATDLQVINGTIYSNAAVLDDKYNIDAEPHLIEI